MPGPNPLDDETNGSGSSGAVGTVFRDMIMLALLGFMAMAILLLPHLNPPSQAAVVGAEPPGNIIVEVRWADESDADVDLWVQGPNSSAVGYSNQSGRLFNLLRDDLGKDNDTTGLNYEVAYSRGIEGGEYTVNLHLYAERATQLPLPVSVVVKVKRHPGDPPREILSKTVLLRHAGEELTVARFDLDGEGQLVAGSLHDLPRKLRNKG